MNGLGFLFLVKYLVIGGIILMNKKECYLLGFGNDELKAIGRSLDEVDVLHVYLGLVLELQIEQLLVFL